jgi:hypothetical protein
LILLRREGGHRSLYRTRSLPDREFWSPERSPYPAYRYRYRNPYPDNRYMNPYQPTVIEAHPANR